MRKPVSLTTLLATAVAALAIASPAQGASIEITDFDGGAFAQNGDTTTLAGSHPYSASTHFDLAHAINEDGIEAPLENLKDAIVELSPGLVGNPQAVATCTNAEFASSARGCPAESQIGVFTLISFQTGGFYTTVTPLYNMVAPKGTAAQLGFYIVYVPVTISAAVRSGDYGLTTSAVNTQESLKIAAVDVEVWGVPADPSHDTMRDECIDFFFGQPTGKACPSNDWPENAKAFFSLPTSCTGPVRTDVEVIGWQYGTDTASFLSHDDALPTPNPVGGSDCAALDFSPTLEARPTTNVADSPSGLEVDLHIPQETIDDPGGRVEAHLRDTTVTLPEGLVINPSGANGLDGCSAAQIDLKGPNPANCPDASKVGLVQVDTPLLDHPVKGAVYVAKPHDNPFDSLLAIYIAVDDPQTGVVVKLAGEVHLDPNTGQLTTTFLENPQLPFEDFKLKFFGGAGGALRTPSLCGEYSTTSSLTPWSAPESGPPATPSDTWQISQGPGGACATSPAALSHAPAFDAGTVSPIAGHYSPFVLNLRRQEGSQQLGGIEVSPPQGLLAKLAGTTRCSEAALQAAAAKTGQAEKASPSCPASSRVGTVVAAAGAGPAPYYAEGSAYLTGPYKGAPLSLAIITPATAGPFDLGTVVIKTALHVDSKTAKINAVSDPIPTILEGIPLDVRSVQVALDRPAFTLNPTSCDPMAVSGAATSTLGQIAPLQSRFQLAECTRLGFKPKISLKLKGGSARGQHPALTVTLKPRPGDANIAAVSVALPRSEFLDQAHIGTVCTRVQFAANACPAASVYGSVSVTTPLLDQPLAGNVYLRSSDNLLPDLVTDLHGPAELPIHFEAAGRTDSIRGGIRNTFDFVPDAPFTKLVVKLKGAKKGLLVNSRNICQKTYRATVNYTAHNGLPYSDDPPLQIKCKKQARKAKKQSKKHSQKHRAQRHAVR